LPKLTAFRPQKRIKTSKFNGKIQRTIPIFWDGKGNGNLYSAKFCIEYFSPKIPKQLKWTLLFPFSAHFLPNFPIFYQPGNKKRQVTNHHLPPDYLFVQPSLGS
jgi:hypothetical protein